MDQPKLEKVLVLLDRFKIPVVIALLGLLLIGFSLLLPKLNSEEKADLKVEDSSQDSKNTTKELTIDVSGAVVTPGVYKMSVGSRIEDVVKQAGGFTAEADSIWVARDLNLAAKISDGQKIYIHKTGETYSSATLGSTSVGSIVNINFASAKELDTLPGIGEVTAQKIISNRPYSKIEDLLTKKAVGKATFEKIKGQISVN